MALEITANLVIDDELLEERFIRASGPGGQNVNKVATAVELRFDLAACQVLPERAGARLRRLAGSRLTDEGVIIIRAERFRTQERNRADARERLAALIAKSLVEPKRRIPTKPSRAARERRLKAKSERSQVKQHRRNKPSVD